MRLPNPEEFNFKDCVVFGDDCWLITPKEIGVKWTEETLKFRSMVVRKSDHFIVSRSFPKFFNWSEQPDLDKFPTHESFYAYEKLDGSLGIFDSYKGQLLARTRGTTDLRQLQNGYELDFLLEKYKKFFDYVMNDSEVTYLCEWQTNNNIIVIGGFPEPKLSLIGGIHKVTGEMFSQYHLDDLAQDLDISRPEKYHYYSIQECIDDVELWVGKEGIVLYSETNKMRKIKGSWYCSAHYFLTQISTYNKKIDFYFDNKCNLENIDFEILSIISKDMMIIDSEYKVLREKLYKIKNNLSSIFTTRKDYAIHVIDNYKNYSAFLFAKNEMAEVENIKKIMKSK